MNGGEGTDLGMASKIPSSEVIESEVLSKLEAMSLKEDQQDHPTMIPSGSAPGSPSAPPGPPPGLSDQWKYPTEFQPKSEEWSYNLQSESSADYAVYPPPMHSYLPWDNASTFRGEYNNPYLLNSYSGYFPPGAPRSVSSVLSRESSRDDLTSMGDGQLFEYEDRFRVDRRKLELLIMGRFEPIKISAFEFFNQISEETSSTIIWPSRLKIGAKSKKDPHIRVGGTEESVRLAKSRIMEFLDTRSNRVTMKMDVSYTDHSHVIGKGGNTIRRVMAETNCHIHFPDSNRSNANEKSNQVSIAGEIDGVEIARSRIRELTPLIFCFDLPIIPSLQNAPDPNDPYLKAVQDQYNVQVTFRQKQKNFHTTMVVIKGCESEAARVKEATMLLMEHLCGNMPSASAISSATAAANAINFLAANSSKQPFSLEAALQINQQGQVVSMTMEISPQHHLLVLGKGNITLKLIMQRTNTTILFPDAADPNIPSIRKGSVTITGSIHNVYLARQQLIGSLPLVLMFDITDDSEYEEEVIQKLQNDLDVAISIKPKARQSNKSVIIKAQERNAGSIYKARAFLLSLDGEVTKATIPENYNIKAMSPSSGLTLPANHRTFQLSSPTKSQASSTVNNTELKCSYTPGGFVTPSSTSTVTSKASKPRALIIPPNNSGQCSPVSTLPPFGGLMLPPTNLPPPGTSHPSSAMSLPPSPFPWPTPPASGHHYTNSLPPNHPYLQDYAILVLNNIQRLQQQQHQLQQQQRQMQNENLQKGRLLSGNGVSPSSNDVLAPEPANPYSPPIPGTSPRNSSPVTDDGNVTNKFGVLHDHTVVSTSSGLTTGSSNQDKSLSEVLENSLNCSKVSNNNNKPKFGLLSDRRAPGCEKEISSKLKKAQHDYSEYDQKKLLATKAIHQNKPAGEVRIPTSSWSGLGFSSSMPESAINQKLKEEDQLLQNRGTALNNAILERSDSILEEENISEIEDPGFHSAPKSPYETLQSKSSGAPQRSRVIFGNSSAFDNLLHHNWIKPGEDDLESVFAKEGLAKYTDLFLRQEIDLRTFASLNDEDLREIGIQTFGARKKLLLLANKTKQFLDSTW